MLFSMSILKAIPSYPRSGFTPEGDIAPKLFYFGYAVFFLVEELSRQGFTSLPERFLELFGQNPKFFWYVLKEFQRLTSTEA